MSSNVPRAHHTSMASQSDRLRFRCSGRYALRIFPALGCYSVACSGGGLTGHVRPWQGRKDQPCLADCNIQLSDVGFACGRLTECVRVITQTCASTGRDLPSESLVVTQSHHGSRYGTDIRGNPSNLGLYR